MGSGANAGDQEPAELSSAEAALVTRAVEDLLRWPCFVCSSQSSATTCDHMSGYLTLDRVRSLAGKVPFFC